MMKQASNLEELKKNVKALSKKRKHHKFSPSNYPAWAMCPFWERANREFAGASRGTRLHDAWQAIMVEKSQMHEIIGAYDLNTHDLDGLKWAKNEVMIRCNKSRFDESSFENKISFSGLLGEVFSGYVDLIENEAIWDLKTGAYSNYSKQIEGYAVAYMQKFGLEKCKAYLLFSDIQRIEPFEFEFESSSKAIEEIVEARKNVVEGNCEGIERNGSKFCTFCKFGKYGDLSCKVGLNTKDQ